MQRFNGLHFKRFDLHVHTPASHDFTPKDVTPEQIVKRALEKKLSGIAITDHHTGSFIDKVKKAAKGKPLVIYPGVEICCTGGKNGIHIIAILDIDKGQAHIESLLANLKINAEDYGKKDVVTTLSPYDVIELIVSEQHKGIAILAHSTSSKGVLGEITGKTREAIFKHKGLLAVESSKSDFINEEKRKKKTRAIDLLSGSDPNFGNRRLAVYIASDSRAEDSDASHSLSGIGSKWTYFKVDEKPSLESLRQCFIDRDVRIRQYFELKENSCPHILEMTVNSGFFDGEKACFHEGLNSILGGKGVGKSLIVEFMRFVLNSPPTKDEILKDHESKLEKRLGLYGSIRLKIQDETGAEHIIERKYDPTEESPYSEDHHQSIAISFNSMFLSQNEIIRLAEDEKEQLKFIDRFFDFRHFRDRIFNLETDLSLLDQTFADGLDAIHQKRILELQIKNAEASHEKISKLLSNTIYDNYRLLEKKDIALRQQFKHLNEIKQCLSDNQDTLNSVVSPHLDTKLTNDPAIKRNMDLIKSLLNLATKAHEDLINKADDAASTMKDEYRKWTATFSPEKQRYQDFIRTTGGDKKNLEQQRIRLSKEITDLKGRIRNLEAKSNSLSKVRKNREDKINELLKLHKEYSDERRSRCRKFEEESNGRLEVNLSESTNMEEFKKRLKELKTGSYFRTQEIDTICENISPYDFIFELLRYHVSADEQKTNIVKRVSEKVILEPNKLHSLWDFLLSEIAYVDLLALQYAVHPEDRPDIRFKIENNEFRPLRELSVGQKCTAMLIMALSAGNFPIIIDQPEDSLDVRSVWDDMCVKIRKGKDCRQFIFTTHNSCLAVASDTDKFTIVEGNAVKGRICLSGAIDSEPIKEEVIRYLEGGRRTYEKKATKYGLK